MNPKHFFLRLAVTGVFVAFVLSVLAAHTPLVSASTLEQPAVNFSAFNAGFAYAPLIDDNDIAVIDTTTHQAINIVDVEQYGCITPTRLRLNPDGTELYVFCTSSTNFVILDTATLAHITSIDRPDACTQDVTFVQDGAYALISGEACSTEIADPLVVLDTANHTIIQSIETEYIVNSIAAHPSLPLAYVALGRFDTSPGGILVIDTDSFEVVTMIPHGAEVFDVQPSPDGQWVFASDTYSAGLAKIEVSSNTILDTLPEYGHYGLEISPDGSRLYAPTGLASITVIDPRSLTVIAAFGGRTLEVELDCAGSELYVPLYDSASILVLEPTTGASTTTISLPGKVGPGLAVCPEYSSNIFAQKTVNKTTARPGELLNYTITAENIGLDTIEDIQLSDTLPDTLTYQEGSLTASSGSYDVQDGIITWTGSIEAGETMTLTFGANVTYSPTVLNSTITNQAVITVQGETLTPQARTFIEPYRLFLPCTYMPCRPDVYTDNFSDPASGWEIEETTIYKMGYVDGAYQILVKPEGYIIWSIMDFGASDFQVEVDTRPVNHLDGGVGLMFSINDYGFYYFEASEGYYGLWRVDWYSWNWVTLVDWTYSPAIHTGFTSNHLKVVRDQGLIELYANGTLLTSLNDTTYMGTLIGLASESWADNYDTRYDNFTLTTGCMGATQQSITIDSAAWVDGAGTRPRE